MEDDQNKFKWKTTKKFKMEDDQKNSEWKIQVFKCKYMF